MSHITSTLNGIRTWSMLSSLLCFRAYVDILPHPARNQCMGCTVLAKMIEGVRRCATPPKTPMGFNAQVYCPTIIDFGHFLMCHHTHTARRSTHGVYSVALVTKSIR